MDKAYTTEVEQLSNEVEEHDSIADSIEDEDDEEENDDGDDKDDSNDDYPDDWLDRAVMAGWEQSSQAPA